MCPLPEADPEREERLICRELLRNLAGLPDFSAAAEHVVELAGRLVPCQSSVFFAVEKGRLEAVAWRTPYEERLAAMPLLKLSDPLLLAAHTERSPQYRTGPAPENSPFAGESAGLACPVPGHGVLYSGAGRSGFEDWERAVLGRLADWAGPALTVAAQNQERRARLEVHARAHRSFEQWAESLALLVEGLGKLAPGLEVSTVVRGVGELLESVVPHDFRTFFLPGQEPLCWPGPLPAPAARDLQDLVEGVKTAGRGLPIDDLRATRFTRLAENLAGLLVSPLRAPSSGGAAEGAVVLGTRAANGFRREHLDLVRLLTGHLGVLLENAGLHGQVVQALEDVKISQAQLVQSSKLAAVGQLAAGVAHELNTPLGAIMLALDMCLREGTSPALARTMITNAHHAGATARDIITRLMVYARDEEENRRQVCDLNQIVIGTVDLLRHLFKDIRIGVCLAPGEAPVFCNPNQVQQVLTNLLINARDAVQSGDFPRQIEVATRRTQHAVLLEVSDRGPGVSPDIASRIFEPFFTTKPVGRGTGLGLAISHQILTAHGGSIRLLPSDAGASFEVQLPMELR
ncbi:MAG: HAMP domain-containing histidine kinase [Armatimonadetes bacterium]|nr:HAMP domain-containing histidine kinase [Armatimonadota bacterium]